MSITAEELRTIGNERSGRSKSQADIDKFIKSWVADLTIRGIILEATEDVDLEDEQPNYLESEFDNLFKNGLVVTVIDSNDNESKPLLEISWHRYKERVGSGDAPGKPREFTRFGGSLYVWPKPDADQYPTLRLSGKIYHSDSTTIVYADRFRECGIQYIIYKIYESLGYLHRETAQAHFRNYEFELQKLLSSESNRRHHNVGYNDI